MFTSIDKALTAVVMAAAFLANTFLGIDLGWDEQTVSVVIAGLTPILVWLVPNRSV
ncbi:MAG: hypothetical protein AAF563_12435 [Pseudomonadota bacterium]